MLFMFNARLLRIQYGIKRDKLERKTDMLVRERMSTDVVAVSPDESAALAARLMSRHNVGALPVCTAEGKLRGMVTDRDIVLRCVANGYDPAKTPLREIMSRAVVTVTPGEDTERAMSLMASGQLRRLPVSENGRVVGILSLGDLAWERETDTEAGEALRRISRNVRRG